MGLSYADKQTVKAVEAGLLPSIKGVADGRA